MVLSSIPSFVLGSGSPRRKDIFNMLGLNFSAVAPGYEENLESTKIAPLQLPKYFAAQKALSLSDKYSREPILGFDTLVFLNGEPLGKPKNQEDALKTLLKLNAKTHQVISGVALVWKGKLFQTEESLTHVSFGDFPRERYSEYVQTREPMDKAGSYGIQGKGAQFVEKIEGCFYNVMGVPLQPSLKILQKIKEPI